LDIYLISTQTQSNKEYGPECAQKAIEGLNGKDMGNEMKLYVRHAMKKTERDAEKKKETLRYKTSKKRCNLYVKNFPNSWPKEQLENIFKQFGEIENIKLEKGKNGSFAFVCFKQPDQAAHAKATLNNYNYEGKSLMINHYEIKELRDIQIHDAIDKADFEKYQQQKTGKFHQNDWTNQPHMTQILQQLLDIMQQNQQMSNHFNQDRNMMRGQGGRRPQNYNNPRGPQNYQQPKPQQMGNMPMPPQMATGMPKPQAQFMNMP
jgi:RNA recognition motif-containing protein